MRQAENYGDGEFEMAIAAAAYAITSLEEKEGSQQQKQRRSVEISQASLPKTRSKIGDSRTAGFGGSFRRWFTDQEAKENGRRPQGSLRIESGKEMRAPSTKNLPSSSTGNRSQNELTAKKRKAAAAAEGWEKTQMLKIKNKYDQTMLIIQEWEKGKKTRAKTRMQQKENQSEKSRARALQKYEGEISRIENVAGKARSLAEEKKRDDEAKTRAKADRIRSTGTIPRVCCCF